MAGEGFEPTDLQIMNLTSYQADPPCSRLMCCLAFSHWRQVMIPSPFRDHCRQATSSTPSLSSLMIRYRDLMNPPAELAPDKRACEPMNDFAQWMRDQIVYGPVSPQSIEIEAGVASPCLQIVHLFYQPCNWFPTRQTILDHLVRLIFYFRINACAICSKQLSATTVHYKPTTFFPALTSLDLLHTYPSYLLIGCPVCALSPGPF